MISVPNMITLARAFLVPAFAMAIFYGNFTTALCIFLVASLSDAVDGFLARKLRQTTTLGVILDPMADKALINSGFLLLSFHEKVIPVWLTILVLSRDILILVGGWLLATFGKIESIKPTLTGKLTAFSQFLTILLVLASLNFDIPLDTCIKSVFFVTATLTIVSGISYSIRGIREINGEKVSE